MAQVLRNQFLPEMQAIAIYWKRGILWGKGVSATPLRHTQILCQLFTCPRRANRCLAGPTR